MKKKPGPKSDVDWSGIKEKYVQGIEREGKRLFPTLDELAELHGLHPATVRKRAGKEDWQHAKREFASKVEQARSEKVIGELATRAANFDLECVKIAEVSLRRGQILMAGKRVLALDPTKNEKIPAVELTAAEYANILGGLKNAQAIGRLALGESTEHSKHSGEIGETGGGVSGLLKSVLADGAKPE